MNLHNFEIWIIWIISVYVEFCSRDTSQNAHLTLEIQVPTESTIITKDIKDRGQNAASSFPHSPFSVQPITCHDWRNYVCLRPHPAVHSERCQTPNMEHFAKIVNRFYSITIFAKHSILDVDSVLNAHLVHLLS